jgi:photosystem II stability/assembly factor-like uncharacterized protein
VILTTSNGGRRWVRIWRGAQELRDLDFINARTGWAVGDGILLGTVDGGQHWQRLGQPEVGPLRQVHFVSPAQGWGVAGGADRADQRSVPATRLVQTSDGGRTWTALAAPAPPQSVCFTAPDDGWLASDRTVWRSVDGGRSWGSRPSFTLPVAAGEPPFLAALQCARPGAAWVRFDSDDHYAGHSPMPCTPAAMAAATGTGCSAPWGRCCRCACRRGPAATPAPSR